MIFLLTKPEAITHCYIYGSSASSIVHSFICTCVIGCGLIQAATMYQIRTSLQVILKQIELKKAERRQKYFNSFCVAVWLLN